jgi:hypothetical protein
MSMDSPGTSGRPLPPFRREEALIPHDAGARAQHDVLEALMSGFPEDEQGQLEHLMITNIERLREDGDSYAP